MQPEPAAARPFPPGYSAFRADDDRTSWTELTADEIEGELGTRVLIGVTACESSGGCFRRREEPNFAESHEYCELPCAAPTEPMPPAPPAPPQLPDFGVCPAGWLTRASRRRRRELLRAAGARGVSTWVDTVSRRLRAALRSDRAAPQTVGPRSSPPDARSATSARAVAATAARRARRSVPSEKRSRSPVPPTSSRSPPARTPEGSRSIARSR